MIGIVLGYQIIKIDIEDLNNKENFLIQIKTKIR